jgi:hypothetical protein
MRVHSSMKLVAAMWIAALLGALAGGALAEASATGAYAPQLAPGESPR